jgi:glutamate dehydrogenase
MALANHAVTAEILKSIEAQLGASASALGTFAALLYDGCPADALAPYTAQSLAQLARGAFEFLAEKRPGRHSIRTRHASLRSDGDAQKLTVLEIVNDDMPFLVDSVMGEIQARGLAVQLVLHPIMKVCRTASGTLDGILGPGDRNWGDGDQESFIAILLDPLSDSVARELAETLSALLDEVRIAVTDWRTMLARLDRAIQTLESTPPPIGPGLLSESLSFCRWLRDGQFTFLGLREYRLEGDAETGVLTSVEGSGLGVLRDPAVHVLSRRGERLTMTPEIRAYVFAPQPLIITKSNIFSRIHRRAHMDYVGLKTYQTDGSLAGELRMVGLFTSQAYTQPPSEIPLLRHRVETVIARSGFPQGSHAGKALVNILTTFPRDELFQISEQRLLEWARGIVDLDLRPRVRVFARPDRFDRFVSVLVYAQRDRYSTAVRERIGALLSAAYDGHVTAFMPFFPEGPLVRVHFIIGRNQGPRPEFAEADLERRITEITRTWDDRLGVAIADSGGSIAALAPKYKGAFSAGYVETFSPERAIEDILRIERLGPERPVAIDFYRDEGAAPSRVRAAVYRFDKPIPLSERVPILENLGFSVIDERSYRVTPRFAEGVREVALHDMMLETADGSPLELATRDARMEQCFLAVFRGEADNDNFNRLVASAGADWREVAALRSYAAYLRQIRSPFGPRYIGESLNRHAGMTRDLIDLFRVRFDPGRKISPDEREVQQDRIRKRLESGLATVASLDEDRILRHYINLILATVRTNFFQRDREGRPPQTLAFKVASTEVEGLADPKPFREIWVYSPRLEGVHLRFAPIARGGLRWSDRAQDFRTEVLALCRAQHVKNAVIVPAGAKGGFVPKQLPRSGSRDEVMSEGLATYRIFVSSLLGITDDIKDGRVAPPPRVVRHDGDDPYLVVAADKGTATFSDDANAISRQHEYWLGDAFASGGSAGYDHKRMGITARGAWECVKRHFREMDLDIQRIPFRVVGVGDMSGDVFGNGMLLSRAIKLIAAFDHRDIFIDPDPDPAESWVERKRLFDLPRSSWQDYSKTKLSKGGGVFSRSAKSIPLSDEMRRLLGVEATAMAPAELMHAILMCETDLLWFGGIGTYVRASTETDEQVGDRANSAIRVTGLDLRAKVIGEGANLGLTQRGRIEFASRGGRLNTDFIDNSAGVNSSDQEVNIKITVGPAMASKRLDAEARRELLASMTEEVAAACLVNNRQQSLALSLAERNSARDLGHLARLMRALEDRGLLDRKLEALPSRLETAAKQAAGASLTRPELAVLLSWAKIALSADLLASEVPDDAFCEPLLIAYFPPPLRAHFLDDIKGHRLRREIIATALTNAMINRGGPAMSVRLADETGRGVADVAYAFLAACSIFQLAEFWREIDDLDGKIPGWRQLDLYARVQDFLLDQSAGFLRQGMVGDLASAIITHRSGVVELAAAIQNCATKQQQARVADIRRQYEEGGIPAGLAGRLAVLGLLGRAPAMTRLARETGRSITDVARIGFAAAEYFRLDELEARANALKVADYYDRLAINGAIHTLAAASRALTREALVAQADIAADFAAWERARGQRLGRAKAGLDEIAASSDLTVSRLTVAASQMRDLAGQ